MRQGEPLPHLARRPRPPPRAVAAPRVERHPGGEHGGQRPPPGIVPPLRDRQILPRLEQLAPAVRAEVMPRCRPPLHRDPARRADEVPARRPSACTHGYHDRAVADRQHVDSPGLRMSAGSRDGPRRAGGGDPGPESALGGAGHPPRTAGPSSAVGPVTGRGGAGGGPTGATRTGACSGRGRRTTSGSPPRRCGSPGSTPAPTAGWTASPAAGANAAGPPWCWPRTCPSPDRCPRPPPGCPPGVPRGGGTPGRGAPGAPAAPRPGTPEGPPRSPRVAVLDVQVGGYVPTGPRPCPGAGAEFDAEVPGVRGAVQL